ncbi:hypothetical protein [Nonomuraea jabiensis]|uniref:hypothetical protein n=1 Tax=Nonomuraea jabiensis TaxID=882448 RepID=UPI003D743BD9
MGNFVRSLATAAAAGAIVLAGTAIPAHAEVWDCETGLNHGDNRAWAVCNQGFGSYRVAAKCNSAHYPYTRTIVGEWRTKVSGQDGQLSIANGDPQGCHVVSAWTQTR